MRALKSTGSKAQSAKKGPHKLKYFEADVYGNSDPKSAIREHQFQALNPETLHIEPRTQKLEP